MPVKSDEVDEGDLQDTLEHDVGDLKKDYESLLGNDENDEECEKMQQIMLANGLDAKNLNASNLLDVTIGNVEESSVDELGESFLHDTNFE